jgi:hypothetical protein
MKDNFKRIAVILLDIGIIAGGTDGMSAKGPEADMVAVRS